MRVCVCVCSLLRGHVVVVRYSLHTEVALLPLVIAADIGREDLALVAVVAVDVVVVVVCLVKPGDILIIRHVLGWTECCCAECGVVCVGGAHSDERETHH